MHKRMRFTECHVTPWLNCRCRVGNTGFSPRFVPFSFFIRYNNITRLNSKELGENPE